MPKSRMKVAAEPLFDALKEYTGGAGMINAPDLARFMGREVRCVRTWIEENGLRAYPMGRCSAYLLRDVAEAMVGV